MPDDLSLPDAGKTIQLEVTINEDGRIVIPKAVRELMGVDGEKATLTLRADATGTVLRSRLQGLRNAQAIVSALVPEGVSLVDELIAGRRAEVARELGDDAADDDSSGR